MHENGGGCVAVPVGVPSVELGISNTSLLVKWSLLSPEIARGRISKYQVLLRRSHSGNHPAVEQPVIATVANDTQHTIDGRARVCL